MRTPSGSGLQGVVLDETYVLESALGRGGFASVWKARDLGTGEHVAVKVFHSKSLNERQLERARVEAELLLALQHPNIANAIAIRLEHEQPHIVLELIEGEPLNLLLSRRCASGRHLELGYIRSIMSELCKAIAFAGERGVVHRDLKPHNIMFTSDDYRGLKVIDFGIARLLGLDADRATTQGRILGSVFYMAPEQARGEPVDTRADIFALGSILFELLTLRRAWAFDSTGQRAMVGRPLSRTTQNSPLEVLAETSAGPRPAPSEHRPTLSAEVDRIVGRATAADPKERYASAAELLAELEATLPEVEDTDKLNAEDQALTKLATQLLNRPDPRGATPLAAALDMTPSGPLVSDAADPLHDGTPADAPVATQTFVPTAAAEPPLTAPSQAPMWALLGILLVGVLLVGGFLLLRPPKAPPSAASPSAVAHEAPLAATPPTVIVAPQAGTATLAEPSKGAAEDQARRPRERAGEKPRSKKSESKRTRPARAQPTAQPNAERTSPAPKPDVDLEKIKTLLGEVSSDPANVQAMGRLRREVLGAARQVGDASAAARIRRITESSAALGDVKGLRRAVRMLEAEAGR